MGIKIFYINLRNLLPKLISLKLMDINYITDAKNEYTKQLQNILIPRLYEGIDSLYDEASKNNNSEDVLSYFQASLRDIPKWNQDIIENENQNKLFSAPLTVNNGKVSLLFMPLLDLKDLSFF